MFVAYIDPGLGALLWQTTVAGCVGFLFYLKKSRRWIVGRFQKLFGFNRKKSETVLEIPVGEKLKAKTDVR